MVCIYCSTTTQVTNSRHQKHSNNIWRRRSCLNCSNIFTTHEVLELETAVMVQKESFSDFEPFSRDKLFISIYESCRHRKNATNDASALTLTVLNKILFGIKNGTVTNKSITLAVIDTLKNFDKAAETMYSAYHQIKN